jgi:hypothetical protein
MQSRWPWLSTALARSIVFFGCVLERHTNFDKVKSLNCMGDTTRVDKFQGCSQKALTNRFQKTHSDLQWNEFGKSINFDKKITRIAIFTNNAFNFWVHVPEIMHDVSRSLGPEPLDPSPLRDTFHGPFHFFCFGARISQRVFDWTATSPVIEPRCSVSFAHVLQCLSAAARPILFISVSRTEKQSKKFNQFFFTASTSKALIASCIFHMPQCDLQSCG